jgi:hypothetical protein
MKLTKLLVLADKEYNWFDLSWLLLKKNCTLVVPPKNYGPKIVHRKFKRTKFHKQYEDNKEYYPQKNNEWSVFSSLKRVQGLKIRARKRFMKKREMGWQIVWV